MFTDDLLVHPEQFVTLIRSRSARRDPTIQLESEGLELKPTSTCTNGLFSCSLLPQQRPHSPIPGTTCRRSSRLWSTAVVMIFTLGKA